MDGMIWFRGEGAEAFAPTRRRPNSVRNELLMTFAAVALSIAFALVLTGLGTVHVVDEYAPSNFGTSGSGGLS